MKKYTESHEWIEVTGDNVTIGITEYAQKELGDIVYVEFPVVGHTVKQGDEVIVLESTKAAVDVYTPLSGEITAINSALREFPEKVNNAAESEGWLFKLKLSQPRELDLFMDEQSYRDFLKK